MKHLGTLLLLLLFAGKPLAQNDPQLRYTKTPSGYLMVLRQGDKVFDQLEAFALKENIPSASFSAMGFAEVEFGFFNFDTKKYRSKRFKAGEVAAMQGSIAWQNGKPSIHSHGMLTNRKFKARGGHILSATVGTGSLEITITVHDQKLERKMDPQLKANVLCPGQCN